MNCSHRQELPILTSRKCPNYTGATIPLPSIFIGSSLSRTECCLVPVFDFFHDVLALPQLQDCRGESVQHLAKAPNRDRQAGRDGERRERHGVVVRSGKRDSGILFPHKGFQ